ncbi:relaxase domain-containing protein [Streptomyces sp. NPDC006314]|uniref:relaxase domain-containing protein n=1 Tax=Streptomyces sp. NPDC006314 TaxID=3154475 RepID=UPI0033BB4835
MPREVTPGRRPVLDRAGVDTKLIDRSSTRRQQIEQALEGITDRYAQDQGRLPSERDRDGPGRWAAQDTRREKKTARPIEQWRSAAAAAPETRARPLWPGARLGVAGILPCRGSGEPFAVGAVGGCDGGGWADG